MMSVYFAARSHSKIDRVSIIIIILFLLRALGSVII